MIVLSEKELIDVDKEVATGITKEQTRINEERHRCSIANAAVRNCGSSDGDQSKELGKTSLLPVKKADESA